MNRFRLSAKGRLAVLVVCSLTITFLSGTSVWTTAGSIATRAVERVVRTVTPRYAASSATAAAPAITASMTATVATDTDGDTKADPGDVIRYRTTITNSGADPATGVHLLDTPDGHTTWNGVTFHVSPLAVNETYPSVGNMTLDTAAIGTDCTAPFHSVVCNDTLRGATLTAFGNSQATAAGTVVNGTNTVTTSNNGTVKLNTDGTFVYNPAAGFEGTDSFWYTLTNTSVTPSLTDSGQVSITVGGASGIAWFVSPGGSGGGTQASPIGMAAFQAKNVLASPGALDPADGDTVFLLAGSHTGPLTLRASQKLIGQGATASVATLGGAAPQSGNSYPSGSSVSITSSANDVVLNTNNTIAGFTAGAATGVAITGGAVGTLKVRDVAINNSNGGASAGALAITTSGAVTNDATFTGFTSVSSTGGVNGVTLTGVTGTLALGTGALSGASGSTFAVNGGNGNIDYNGTISKTTDGLAVSVQNHTGGTVSFDGTVSSTSSSDGVSLSSNGGATITFTNTLTLNTSASGTTAFNATGGGTVTATASGSTISSGAGTALNVVSTTIGASGLTFQSISANGGSNGIVLNGTGSGPLTVTGVGTTNASGGTIQNISTRGIDINSAANVTLKNMALVSANNSTDAGGAGVCDDLNISACNAAIYLGSVSGATLDNVDVSGTMVENGLTLVNVSNFSLLNSTVTNAGNEVNESGIEAFNLSGTSVISNSDISFSETNSLDILNNDVSLNLTISSSTFRDSQTVSSGGATNVNGEGGLQFRSFSRSLLTGSAQSGGNVPVTTINIANSSFLRLRTQGIQVFSLDDSILNLDITGSTIDAQSDIGTSIDLNASGTSTYSFNVVGNPTIQSRGGGAVNITSFDSSHIEGRLNNNPDIEVLGGAGIPVRLVAQELSSMVVEINGNTVSNVNGTEDTAIDVQSRFQSARVDVAITNNTVTEEPTGVAGINLISGSSTAGESNTTCASVANNNVTNAVGNVTRAFRVRNSDLSNANRLFLANFTTDTATTWINRGNIPATAAEVAVSVTVSGVLPLAPPGGVCNAVDTPSDFAGVSPGSVETLNASNLDTAFSSIKSGLRSASASLVTIAEETAGQAAVFLRGLDSRRNAALVAVANARESVTRSLEPQRVRSRIGRAADRLQKLAAIATDALVAPLHASGPAVDITVDAIPAGKSVTVVFDVTVDTPPVASYSNHATITGAEFSSVDTNTVTTNGDRFDTTTAVISSLNPVDQGVAVTFTATVTPEAASTVAPDGTVTFNFGDATPSVPVTCSASGGNCVASTTHTYNAGGLFTISTVYGGGTNHDASTSPGLSQTVIACNAAPMVLNGNDAGPDSLRQLLLDACTGATITFTPAVTTVTLTSGELSLAKNVTISGPGASALTITRDSGAANFRVFHNQPNVTATISGMTVSGGSVVPTGPIPFDRDGGGILNEEGTLTLQSVVVTGNFAFGHGSGVLNGTVNFGTQATMTILDSTIAGNGSSGHGPGGGLSNYTVGSSAPATMTIRRSTISGNATGGIGGGIMNDPFRGNIVLTATDTTISGNTSAGNGGGISNNNGSGTTSQVTLTNVTVTANQANVPATGGTGGGIHNVDTVTLRNTIVAGNNNGDVVGALTNSFNNLIGNGDSAGGVVNGIDGNLVGTGASPIDPRLGPLANNGGPTMTHALLAGSPAFDGGDNTFVFGGNDQRGTGYVRVLDGADAGSTATTDIGAVEAQVSVEDIADKTTNEDVPLSFPINVGDTGATVTAMPADTGLAAINVTGSGATRTVAITPAPEASGSTLVTVTVTRTVATVTDTMTDTFQLTVNNVDDLPTLDPIANPAAINEDAGQQTVNLSGITPGGGEPQTVSITATSANTALIPNPTVDYSGGLTGSLTYTPVANAKGSAVITVTATDSGLQTFARTFTVAVNAIADTASVTNATTNEDVQTTSGLVVSRNAVDGAETTHVKVTGVTNGTLFLNDGTTSVANGSFVSFAAAAAGFKFTPSANFFGTGSFAVEASTSASDAGLGGGPVTATITVNAVADTPSVTAATTKAQVPTTSGLVITRNAADTAEVTHVKITNIQHGTLFLNDGTTAVTAGQFITIAQGAAGLKFTPADGFAGTATFDVQASLSNTDAGLGGSTVTASIAVARHTTATTILSANPDPSDRLQTVPVVFTVVSTDGGPTPTGDVVVTISGGTETCIGTAAAGSCALTLSAAGSNRTITATYVGDALSAGSSATLLHTVLPCPATPVVTNTNDSGAGSLREAIADACTTDSITFSIAGPGPHTIQLTGGSLVLIKNLTITGSADGVRISGGGSTQIMRVQPGATVSLSGLTLADGFSVPEGGAVMNDGVLTVAGSTFSANASDRGAAILNRGALTVTNSTFSANAAGMLGGAIFNDATAVLTNVTITANSAAGDGAGIWTQGALTIENSIVAGNASGNPTPDLFTSGPGTTTDLGHNLLSGDPRLGPLQDNGGPTFTHAPLPGSPALDAGDNAAAAAAGLTADQRGAARMLDAADADTTQTIDIGAVEADPSMAAIPDTATNEDTPVSVTFNVGDAVTPFDSIAASSANTALVANANLIVTGSGSTRTLTITPMPGAFGTAAITVTAAKTIGGTAVTSATTFTLTVNAVNDAPTLNPIADPAAILEDAASQTVNLSGISAGAGEIDTVAVTATSSNTALIPNPAVSYTSPAATGSLTYTPVANASGTATITVTVTDLGGLSVTRTFSVVVTAANDTPTVSTIVDQTLNEDTATSAIAFTVGDVETAASALTVSGASSNTALVPNANIVFGGSGANRTVTVTPAANQSGSATITVSVSDGTASSDAVFQLTVTAVNDLPTITAIADQSTNVATATAPIAFTVGDVETAAGSLTVSGTSSNTTLVPNANILFGGSGASRTVSLVPAAGQAGTATITVIVSDGTATASRTFVLTVGAPVAITGQPQSQTISAGQPATLTVTATGTGPLAYQWYAGSSGNTAAPVSGATSSSYTTPALTAAASYWVRVSNPYGSPVDSATAAIAVQHRILSLSGDLAFGSVPAGTTATRTFNILNSGDAPLTITGITYPAGFSGDFAGGTVAHGVAIIVTVTFAPTASTAYGGSITVLGDQTSGANTLTASGTGADAAPTVTAHPINRTLHAGGSASFTAAAAGSPTPSVQWQRSVNSGVTWVDIAGATAATYTRAAAASDSGDQFRAVFTNRRGSVATAGATLRITNRARADFDGDGSSDLVVWRGSTGTWFWLESSSGFSYASQKARQWGTASQGDVPLLGDIDGDGRADLGIWRPVTGTWFWLTASTGYTYGSQVQVQFGDASLGDVPLTGDMDGDGKTDLILWRASTGTWRWLTSSSGYAVSQAGSKQWGNQGLGDVPLVADIDGDGLDDLTVWRASTGTWYWLTSSTGFNYPNAGSKQWGDAGAGDVPRVGDVDGDGKSDLLVWRASTGMWYWLTSSSDYSYTMQGSRLWGNSGLGDVPTIADFDRSGKAALTVWRASTGTWYWLLPSSDYAYSGARGQQWGIAPDVAMIK